MTTDSQVTEPVQGDWRAWAAVGAATLCSFQALMNVTVTNTALPQIQASIGASGTEGTWVGTAYLAAEVVIIPLTAWLGRLLGLRRFILIIAVVFASFSLLCAWSTDLVVMILGRTGQGLAGGAMIPIGLTIIATRLTPAQRPLGLAIYSTMSVLGPLIGPPIGGWFTDNLTWHWVFYMNLPITLLTAAMTLAGISPEPVRKEELAKADWTGILGLSLMLATLIVVLEEGQRENWFESAFIVRLSIISAFGLLLLVYSQFRQEHPILKLRLFQVTSFSATIACSLIMGAASFVVIYLVPTFLGLVAGYDAQQTGWVAGWSGITSFLLMPLFAYLLSRVDIRWMVATGFTFYALSTVLDTRLTGESVGIAFLLTQLIRGGAQMVATLPLSQAVTAGLKQEDIPDGAAMFSIARNLGGALGLALTGVLIDRQTAFHAAQIGAGHTANSWAGSERIGQIVTSISGQHTDMVEAHGQALKLIGGELQRQALVLAYIDAFWYVSICLILTIPIILFIRQPITHGREGAH